MVFLTTRQTHRGAASCEAVCYPRRRRARAYEPLYMLLKIDCSLSSSHLDEHFFFFSLGHVGPSENSPFFLNDKHLRQHAIFHRETCTLIATYDGMN